MGRAHFPWMSWLGIALCQLFSANTNPAGAQEKKAPVRQMPRLDALGDQLPPGAVSRIGSLRLRHMGTVTGVALSPDGKLVASAGGDKTIRLWDAATGKEVNKFAIDLVEGGVLGVGFSSDGKTLIGSDGGSVRLWDVKSGGVLGVLQGGGGRFALSADGRRLISMYRAAVRVVDLESRDTVKQFNRKWQGWKEALAVSPDGRLVAFGFLNSDGDGIRVYESNTGNELWTARGPRSNFREESHVSALTFSPDGKTLAVAAYSKAVHLYDARTGAKQGTLGAGATSIAFSPDGSLLALGHMMDGTTLWDVGKGEKIRHLRGLSASAQALAFSRDGKTLASGCGGAIRLWTVQTGVEAHPNPGHHNYVQSLVYLPDGRTLAAHATDFTARLWDTATGTEVRRFPFPSHDAQLWAYHYADMLAASPDGKKVAVCGWDKTFGVGLWNVADGKVVRLKGHKGYPFGVAFTADGKTLITGDDHGGIHFWDADTAELRKQVFTGEVRKIFLGGRETTFEGIINLACSPDGKTLAASISGVEIRLWNLADGKEIARLSDDHESIAGQLGKAMAFSPDSQLLATTSNRGGALLWDLRTGQVRAQFKGEGGVAHEVSFSPDGGLLAMGMEYRDAVCTVQLWEVATGRKVFRFRGHERAVNAIAFSPDGRRLASGSQDTTILIWDVFAPGRQRTRELGADLGPLWLELAGDDAPRAYAAACALVLTPEKAVGLFSKHLRPVPQDEKKPGTAKQLIDDLNHDTFAVREAALRELKLRGWEVWAALREALKKPASAEARTRVEHLLADLEKGTLDPEVLRQCRAVQVLERIGSDKARQLLQELAQGAAWAAQTRDASAALKRLSRT